MDPTLYCVYLLASGRRGTLYPGATSQLVQRVWQHKSGLVDGFTRRHAVHHLVWFEVLGDPRAMVTRERQIKEWRRAWKIELIEAHNPMWHDLYANCWEAAAGGSRSDLRAVGTGVRRCDTPLGHPGERRDPPWPERARGALAGSGHRRSRV